MVEEIGRPAAVPTFAHLPLLIAPDGSKLSKRKHGPVVSVTTYRDGGFLPHAYVNFLCLLGWSPKDDREQMTRDDLVHVFGFQGINRSNAVVNFTEEDPFDPKATWLNASLIRTLPVDELAKQLLPFAQAAGFRVDEARMREVTPLIHERIKTLKEIAEVADFIFVDELNPYDPAELIPQKGDAALAKKVLEKAREILAVCAFEHDALEAALRAGAEVLKIKAGSMFQPIRVAACGRKNAPPLFDTLVLLGREKTLQRIDRAIQML